jgi:hypothetical protein
MQQRRGDAGFGGDIAQRGRGDALDREAGDRGIEQACAQVGGGHAGLAAGRTAAGALASFG